MAKPRPVKLERATELLPPQPPAPPEPPPEPQPPEPPQASDALALFHSPYEFLTLRATDPRCAVLEAHAAREAADPGMRWFRRLAVFGVTARTPAGPLGSRLQPIMLCATAVALAAFVSEAVALALTRRVDVARLCTERRGPAFAMAWDGGLAPAAGSLVVVSAIVGCIAIQASMLGGIVPWWRVARRHWVQFFLVAHVELLVVSALRLALLIWSRKGVAIAFQALVLTVVPLADMSMDVMRSALAVRFGMLGVVVTNLVTWVTTRLDIASCLRLSEPPPPLSDLARTVALNTTTLVYSIILVGIVWRRVVSPRIPFATCVRRPFVSLYGDGPSPFVPHEVIFGLHGMTIAPVGSSEALIAAQREGAGDPRGSWTIVRPRPPWAVACLLGLTIALTLVYIGHAGTNVAIVVLTADVEARCFDAAPRGLDLARVVVSTTGLAITVFAVGVMLTEWRHTVRSPWRSLARYWVGLWRSRPVVVWSALLYVAFSLLAGAGPTSPTPLVGLAVFPVLDVGSITAPRRLALAARCLVAAVAASLVTEYIRVTLCAPNLCSRRGRQPEVAAFIFESLAQACDAIWSVATIKLVSCKLGAGTHPFAEFRVLPGAGHDNPWLPGPPSEASASSAVLDMRLRAQSGTPGASPAI
jgi:hypothetical protein